jgi:hypothetical protein
MKLRIVFAFVFVAVCLLYFPSKSGAQQGYCFDSHYSSYTSYSVGSDGASIAQTVQESGYISLNNPAVWGGPSTGWIYPCTSQNNQMQSSTHTFNIRNVVGSTGGDYSQGPTPALNYNTYSITITAPAADGVVLSTSAESKVECPVAGTIFSSLGSGWIEFAKTMSQYTGPGPTSSQQSVTPWCTPETTPPDYSPSYAVDRSGTPSPFYLQKAICKKQTGAPGGAICILTTDTGKPSPQNKYSCTKNL